MSEEIKDIPDENIEAPQESIVEDEDSVQAVIKRKKNGTFRRGQSGNLKGRPKNTKNKHSEEKLTSLLNRGGAAGIQMVTKIMYEAYEKEDRNLAMKCGVWLGEKYYQVTLHNQKLEMQRLADKKKEKVSEEDEEEVEDYTKTGVVFTFGAANS